MTENYSPFTELMSYFYFNFNVYYALLAILALNVLKTGTSFFNNPDGLKQISAYDYLISLLVGVGLFNALYFQGVLSDISTEESDKWVGKMVTICIAAFLLFIVQVVFGFITHKRVIKENNR